MDRGEQLDVILCANRGDWMSTQSIVKILISIDYGDELESAPRPDALILSALKRHEKKYGWECRKEISKWYWRKPMERQMNRLGQRKAG